MVRHIKRKTQNAFLKKKPLLNTECQNMRHTQDCSFTSYDLTGIHCNKNTAGSGQHEILWNKRYVNRSPIEEAPVSMEVILEEHVELPQGETELEMDVITTAELLRFVEKLSIWTCLCVHNCLVWSKHPSDLFSVILSVIKTDQQLHQALWKGLLSLTASPRARAQHCSSSVLQNSG